MRRSLLQRATPSTASICGQFGIPNHLVRLRSACCCVCILCGGVIARHLDEQQQHRVAILGSLYMQLCMHCLDSSLFLGTVCRRRCWRMMTASSSTRRLSSGRAIRNHTYSSCCPCGRRSCHASNEDPCHRTPQHRSSSLERRGGARSMGAVCWKSGAVPLRCCRCSQCNRGQRRLMP